MAGSSTANFYGIDVRSVPKRAVVLLGRLLFAAIFLISGLGASLIALLLVPVTFNRTSGRHTI